MQAYIITTFIGSFGVNEDNKIVAFRPFPNNPKAIAEKLKHSEIEVIDEEKQLMQDLWKKDYKKFIFSFRKPEAKYVEPKNKAEEYVKENLRKIAIEKKFVKDQVEFNQLLTKINLELTKVKIKKAVERDSLIVQTNGAIEELDKSINIFVERLREWYGLHFPEMDRMIDNHEKFAKIVEKFGPRNNIDDPELKKFAAESMGVDFSDNDIKTMQTYASEIIRMQKLREDLAKYLENILKEIAPNFTDIAGSMIAAKLIAKAGGVGKLAKAPSSTIQLLGAEKSLFRYLHGKGKSPRFGIIFNHPFVQRAPEQLKGRVARVLAAKLSIAIKIDYYSKEYRGEKLKNELQEKVKEILSSK